MTPTPRIWRNDWGTLEVPPLGAWSPSLSVSVIMPAFRGQEKLDLALAALSVQSYPSELLEVVVVDDGSQPPLRLPELRPANCRLLRVADHNDGWGQANALNIGVANSGGEIVHRLDSDMVVFTDHVEALARWLHVLPYGVSLGYKRFVEDWSRTPHEVVTAAESATIDKLYPYEASLPHDYIEDLIDHTEGLRHADHYAFRAHVGASVAVRREMFERAGGVNADLLLGEDTEFGYRLAQAGAVFIPDPAARAWHLGLTTAMREGDAVKRCRMPALVDLMPLPKWFRSKTTGRGWTVPMAVAVVTADGGLEQVRATVDALLAAEPGDLHVALVGPWDAIDLSLRRTLPDEDDLRLIYLSYRCDPRVRLVSEAPCSAFPSPYLLRVPVGVTVGRSSVKRLIAEADQWQAGLLRTKSDSGQPMVELWRTSAVGRALLLGTPQESLDDAVTELYGRRWASHADMIDDGSHQGLTVPAQGKRHRMGVQVAGVRSLARATLFVARQAVTRMRRQVP